VLNSETLTLYKNHTQIDIRALQSSWQAFDEMAHLRPIHDEESYERMIALMNSLLEAIGDDEDHVLSSLLDLVSDIVSRYEQQEYAIKASEPRDVLRFMMEARGLKQEDLASVVPQSNLSAILSGKRKISATLAAKLGKFFGISPAVFVPVL
jgi:HTH-type transcriptional regulator/antitoxin HigA